MWAIIQKFQCLSFGCIPWLRFSDSGIQQAGDTLPAATILDDVLPCHERFSIDSVLDDETIEAENIQEAKIQRAWRHSVCCYNWI